MSKPETTIPLVCGFCYIDPDILCGGPDDCYMLKGSANTADGVLIAPPSATIEQVGDYLAGNCFDNGCAGCDDCVDDDADDSSFHSAQGMDGVRIEAKAREIYDGWKGAPGWVPWVEGGNSHKQDDARRIAKGTL